MESFEEIRARLPDYLRVQYEEEHAKDTQENRDRVRKFEEIVKGGFEEFSSKQSQIWRPKLVHNMHPWNSWESEDGRHELLEEEYRGETLISIPRLFISDPFWRFRPGSFFVIKHPRKIVRVNGKDKNVEYDFKNLHTYLTGKLGRDFLPYAENIYNKLVSDGIIRPYSGPIYWSQSGPELRDSDENVHILRPTEPFLRKTTIQAIKF
jgi:hypothetical protein